MDKVAFVKKAFNMDGTQEEQAKYLSEDYQFVDSLGNPPMNKDAWFGLANMLRASVPDLDFIIDEIHQEGEDVMMTGHFTGTFKKDLDLTAMNMGVIPATGKSLNIPGGTSRISFDDGKISKNKNLDTGPTAGMAGFLSAFGAN